VNFAFEEFSDASLTVQPVPTILRSAPGNEPQQEQVDSEENGCKEHVGQHLAPTPTEIL
jgi:hypothetical protein